MTVGILASEEFELRSQELIGAGQFFHERGWAPATSGNYSARLAGNHIAITVSGVHKGELTPTDLMVVDLGGHKIASHLDTQRSSAETLLHTQVYGLDEKVGAVLHSHSPVSTVISRLRGDRIILKGYELQKAFPGIETHAGRVIVPIFDNEQHIPRLARQVEAYWQGPEPMFGYLIRGHGLYSWGARVADARRHIEAFEFMFECEILEDRARR